MILVVTEMVVMVIVMVEMKSKECSEFPLSCWVSAGPRLRKDGFQFDNSLV